MTTCKVLIEGYATKLENGWLASSSAVLIKNEKGLILADPGCSREKLLNALKNEGLSTADINFVFLTHGHIDHTALSGIFENARLVTFENLTYDKDLQLDLEENVLGKDVQIVQTPGHAPEHISLIVNTGQKKYAVAGDVFWWVDGEKQIVDVNKQDNAHPIELNMEKLIASRKLLLDLADFIIPGHGKMFKVKE